MQRNGSIPQNSNNGIKSQPQPITSGDRATLKYDGHAFTSGTKKSDSSDARDQFQQKTDQTVNEMTARLSLNNQPMIDTKSPKNVLFENDLSDIKGDSKSQQDSARGELKSNLLQFDSPRIDNPSVYSKNLHKQKIPEGSAHLYGFDEAKYQRTDEDQSYQYNQEITGDSNKELPAEEENLKMAVQLNGKATDDQLHDINLEYPEHRIERPRQQNQKLKRELGALAKTCDNLLIKEIEIKQNRNKIISREDPELIEKQIQIKQQCLKIDTLKNQIALMKRQLENTYNLAGAISRENELHTIEKEIARLKDEKEMLTKINEGQYKALDFLKNAGGEEEKLKRLTEELKKAKEEHRILNEQGIENEKVIKKNHERIVTLDEKAREIKLKIQHKKSKDAQERSQEEKLKKPDGKKLNSKASKQKADDQFAPFSGIEVNEEIMMELEKRLSDIKANKIKLEQKLSEDIKKIELEKKEILIANARLQTIIKQKDKEIRINNLRLRELHKLSRFNALKPLEPRNKGTLSSSKNASELQPDEDDEAILKSSEHLETHNPSRASKIIRKLDGNGLSYPSVSHNNTMSSFLISVLRTGENNKSIKSIGQLKSPRSNMDSYKQIRSAREKVNLYSEEVSARNKLALSKQSVAQDKGDQNRTSLED